MEEKGSDHYMRRKLIFFVYIFLFSPNIRDFNSLNVDARVIRRVLQLLSVIVCVFFHLRYERAQHTVDLNSRDYQKRHRQQQNYYYICVDKSQCSAYSYPSGWFFWAKFIFN